MNPLNFKDLFIGKFIFAEDDRFMIIRDYSVTRNENNILITFSGIDMNENSVVSNPYLLMGEKSGKIISINDLLLFNSRSEIAAFLCM